MAKKVVETPLMKQYFEMKHSGHGLQNDSKMYAQYMRKILEYLDTYMPVK